MSCHRIKTFLILLAVVFSFSAADIDEQDVWTDLKTLIGLHGVSENEGEAAEYIADHLPGSLKIETDDMKNVWFSVGKGRPHLVFVAHSDELGFVVEDITSNGRLTVRGRGGFFAHMYEGRPVEIFTGKEKLFGIVAPRPEYLDRETDHKPFSIEEIRIDIGVDSQKSAIDLGVKKGNPITIRKTITELSRDILAARAVDDRAGCAVLLAAAWRIDWSKMKRGKVTFAWDVQEETGLRGAARLAKTLNADYVFPIDTFVSSAGPLDDKRFAYITQGTGVVLRAIDSSGISPRKELEKVMMVAKRYGIPYQLSNTRGGNDGSAFVVEGAVNLPLSWPGLYSHSFIEKINRLDLEALVDLVIALVYDFPRKPEGFIKTVDTEI